MGLLLRKDSAALSVALVASLLVISAAAASPGSPPVPPVSSEAAFVWSQGARDPGFFLDLASHPVLASQPAGGGGVHLPHPPIRIVGDGAFALPGGLPNVANGVVRGNGTEANPYVIEGWDVGPLPGGSSGVFLRDTTKHALVRNNVLHDHRFSASDREPLDTTATTTTGAGVKLVNARNVRVEGNDVRNNVFGLVLYASRDAHVRDNAVVAGGVGWWMEEMTGPVTATGNTVSGAFRGFGVYARQGVVPFVHAIDGTNSVNGLPIRYLVGAANVVLSPSTHPAGAVAVVNGDNVSVTGYLLSRNAVSVLVAGGGAGVNVHNVTLEDNEAGLLVVQASGVTFQDSVVRRNIYGARFENAPQNRVTHNAFDNNTRLCCVADAVLLRFRSDDVRVDNNTLLDNQVGVDVLGEARLGGCPLGTRVLDNNFARNWWAGVFEEFGHPLVACLPDEVNATRNHWGAPNGPSSFEGFPVPGGEGDAITRNVEYAPFSAARLPSAGPRA